MKKDNYRSKYNNAVHDTHHIKCYFCSESLCEVTELSFLLFCYTLICLWMLCNNLQNYECCHESWYAISMFWVNDNNCLLTRVKQVHLDSVKLIRNIVLSIQVHKSNELS